MKFVTQRELRVDPGKVWALLRVEKNMVITSHGKPVALLYGIDDADLENTFRMIRRVRGLMALEEIQRRAEETGLSKMTMAEINREIQAVRKRRKLRK